MPSLQATRPRPRPAFIELLSRARFDALSKSAACFIVEYDRGEERGATICAASFLGCEEFATLNCEILAEVSADGETTIYRETD